ncbi:hypothetical protein Rhopal_002433-T1 [Rhodotorula paludigena]|uniref:Deacetylase sirtuin-type domain-containing protein n=1 Tax=Rhodotorula paludigena TaxID=86838 RepID=A0AAV5GJ22_9BASI|nr:hypothetical protein Rhopal_002433-T1 [Rhodotorula paludigena]
MQSVEPGAGEPRACTKALDAISLAVAKSRRTVLLVGAGISTNAGIPDFRSQGSGLYASSASSSSSRLRNKATTPRLKGPELFSASVYSAPETTSEHLRFIAAFKRSLDSITSSSASPSSSHASPKPLTPTHDFMRTLKKRNKLLRVYTQNIDGFEGVGTGLRPVPLEGITPKSRAADGANAIDAKGKGKGKAKIEGDFVQLHGSVLARTLSSLSRAFLRPAITLYNESPPASSALTIGTLSLSDLSASPGPDVMLVMGTSLKIPGFKKLVKEFARSVKSRGGLRVLVNREEIGSKSEWKDVFDYQGRSSPLPCLISDTDDFVTRLVDDWKRLRPQDWTGRQSTLGEMLGSKKGSGSAAATNKPSGARPPLAPLSPNSPARSSKLARDLPFVSHLASLAGKKRRASSPSLPSSPSKCARTAATSSTYATPPRPCAGPGFALSGALPPLPTPPPTNPSPSKGARKTRNSALRPVSSALFSSPLGGAGLASPSKIRSSVRRSVSPTPTPTAEEVVQKLRMPFKPPRQRLSTPPPSPFPASSLAHPLSPTLDEDSDEGEGPDLVVVQSKEGTVISPEL